LLFLLMVDEPFLTSEQVAEALSVTPQTIRNWIRRGTLPAEKYGHVFRVRREDFEAFVGARSASESARPGEGTSVWAPETAVLPRWRARSRRSVWDAAGAAPVPRRKHS
jgi:excisionase family DNA binding protein